MSIVKKITIDGESRDLGAKYDDVGDKPITEKYLTVDGAKDSETGYLPIAIANSNFLNKDNLKKINNQSIIVGDDGVTNIEVLADIGKRLYKEEKNTSIIFPTESLTQYRYIKCIVYETEVSSDTETGSISLNGQSLALGVNYLKLGSTYEIYDGVLICTNLMGDVQVLDTKQSNITSLSITSTQKIGIIVYKEIIPYEEDDDTGGEV
jgi:hypothetical protein